MASGKGQGHLKGEKPSLKAPPKQLVEILSSLDDEDDVEDQLVIPAELLALKQVQGLSLGRKEQPPGTQTRQASQKRFQSEISHILSYFAARNQAHVGLESPCHSFC